MKYSLLLSLLVLALFSACKKDAANGLNYYAYAEKNDNTTFNATSSNGGFRSLTAKDTLYLGAHSGEDNIVIRIIAKGTGTYTAPNLDAIFYTTLGQDVVIRTYHLTNDPDNILKITNIDNGVAEGTFSLTFKETVRGLTGPPSVFTLNNGRIRSQIGATKYDAETFFQRF